MRVSTGMIFDAGISSVSKQSSSLLRLQQQISTGRRLLAPSDDPVAAARALEVSQAKDVVGQYAANLGSAKSALALEEGQLQSVTDLLAQAKQLAIQGGNAGLGNSDRQAIATQLRAIFDEAVSIANATDGTGQYLFAGYMSNTKPFAGTVAGGVAYFGDDGRRGLQISAAQQMPVSDSGNDVFNRIRTGNGYFATGYAAGNSGSGIVGAGSVTDPVKWAQAANSGDLQVSFWVDAAGDVGPKNATYYDLVDASSGMSLFTGAPSATGAGGSHTHAYSSGQAISFSGLAAPYGDFGATVVISGAPASGDRFTVKQSESQSIFSTLANLIGALERPASSGTNNATRLANDIGFALTNISAAEQNVLTVRASIGSRLAAIELIEAANDNMSSQLEQTLSGLQDVDYSKAVSELTQTQMQLDAAQKSFVKVSQLSLFQYV